MSYSWVFLAAAATALVTTPLFRRLARSVGLFDEPSPCKIQAAPVPYLGGLAIAVGTLTGILVGPHQGLQVGAVGLVAAGLCALGLFDDDHHLRPRTRLSIEVVAAVSTLALGLRFHLTGVGVVDGALTVVWIVGLTNALNLLDNMDGLAAGVAASMAASSLPLTLGGNGPPVAALGAAVAGACLGFLAYNKRPASVYMGDAGSLFLGYLLAVITLAAAQSRSFGPAFVVPLMLAAVPLADTTTVIVARLRRGMSPMQAGTDHLSHRLVRRGLPPGRAVVVLVTASLLIGVLGSLSGRGTLPLSAAVAAAATVLFLLMRAAVPAGVYDEPVTGLPLWMRLLGAAGIVGATLAWQTGLVPGSGSTVAFRWPTTGFGLAPTVLLGGGLAVVGTTLLVVVRNRRQAIARPFPADLLIAQEGR